MDRVKVMIVDDHEMVRLGIRSYLLTEEKIDLVAEAGSGKEAVQLAKENQPHVILMDLLMENGTGIDATKEIMQFLPNCKIIILTSYYDDEQVFPAIEAGVHSYILKTSRAEEVTEAIYKAVRGESVIEPKVANKMMNRFRPQEKKPHEDLTEREIDVLKCLGEGMTNQEISEYLFIGVKTVKTHVSNILGKLGVSDRTQAAIYANRQNITLAK
ncbi:MULTISPECIES: response regulator transcription factor [Heyndrickxia]|uniref:DNA-binding response regulator n=1 Tax=Heyndrickxia oleronia TaxID=38875 RepID=A0A8E2IAB7_9BACI|nr:response regulator transcription factor [Heyndrickxia oleronia]NYV67694.1 response regulator transcription factor [Bacillus sp. Gen3]MCI1592625.1 response regulator transcription factor [Heyndrickxia oleronia]MCI1613719.1 response regulator transcription factor [Heyndrickxia oleronia]MCI1744849.1 response regulator transcription factor [Heyndrickxia oleronia]MCI1761582.1 response regulator transcription factor [Heyndrickxia oleronia]